MMTMAENVTKQPVKILVADDQEGMRLTLKAILNKKGYEVVVAEDGYGAIEAAKKTDFRVVLMDVKMPGISGVDAYLKIKEFNPKATIILMTAFAVEDEIKKAIREGAYTVVYKPFDMENLFSLIHECIEGHSFVLAVDDNVEQSRLLKEILESRGYKVICVASGEECVYQLKEKRYSIILLDILLPGMNGFETLKHIREIRPDVGVVMVTAFSTEEWIQKTLREGGFVYVNKPYDMEKLLQTISHVIKGEKP